MADKQLAYDTRKKTELFDEGDPLAELARIVGFEPRVAANTVPEVPRQEPALNLEDELLREFERFDAPRPLAGLDRPAEPAAEEYDYPASDAIVEPDPVDPPAATSPGWHGAEMLSAADWAAPQVSEPVSGGARDLIEELELSIGGPTVQIPQASTPARAPQWSAASIKLPLANFHAARRDELVESPAKAAAPVDALAVPEQQLEPFGQVQPVIRPEPAMEPVAFDPAEEFEATAPQGFPAELDRHDEVVMDESPAQEMLAPVEAPVLMEPRVEAEPFDLVAAATEGVVQADAALTEAPFENQPIAFEFDDLLADVSRYPVPERLASAPVEPKAAPFEQWEPLVVASAAAAPVAAPVAVAPVAAPVDVAPVAAPIDVAPAAVPVDVAPAAVPVDVAPAAAEPPAVAATAIEDADSEDPFAGHDFELDLEGIELELADLDFAEPAKTQEPAPVVAAPAAVVVARPVGQFAAASPYEAPPHAAAVESKSAAADGEEDLPFDASMIAEADHHPEAVEDMHVPSLPPVEQPAPVAPANDFDFDVDAEIASLFETSVQKEPAVAAPAWAPAAAPAWAPAAAAAVVAAAPVAARPQSAGGPDDFERALEEDFRRSVREPVHRAEAPAEVRIQSAAEAEDMGRARSMKRLLAAAALIVVFAGGAYGVYSVVTDGGLGIAGGEPRVIVADKEPVKIVPENPGGKTVPNQDKAVYDRVAGATEAPKQKALVSSDEEPVDVVQRTLTPEVLPEDNDGPIADNPASTPVGDTQDPRLLPSEDVGERDAAAEEGPNGDRPPAVAPRKVRTMIVKPDGTLVAREEPAAPVEEPSVQPPAAVAASGGSAASFPASKEVASADIGATPVETTTVAPLPAAQQPSTSTLEKIAAADPATAKIAAADPATAKVEQPVHPVQTPPAAEKPADTAPVPTARPAEQPVTVVGTVTEKGNVRPAEQQAKPAEVSSVEPAAAKPQQASPAGGYGMQIASLPSEAEAKKSYASLSKKFASVLGGRSFEIRKAEIAGKGTFYRVRIPAGSKDEAAALCQQYRSAGGSCLISK
ncbi:sporulation related domain-containing protein [Rhizobium etli 8C-3]|uniref:Sporulation related domain-containing protein n=1 Tax=Rhizobium etli 8C-3 TaxID=538025 RepID=A0A1L5P379_RHIET|nr:SPOR domain-containing protein [Rhizobium etli]APO74603.1 sporulation related domain-containing protein [Rhizobium etli 8C-3]